MKIFFLFKQMELREAKNKNKEKPSQPKLFLEKLCLEKLINIVSNYLRLSCSFKAAKSWCNFNIAVQHCSSAIAWDAAQSHAIALDAGIFTQSYGSVMHCRKIPS